MHPASRIACLLVFAALLPLVPEATGIAFAILCVLFHVLFLRSNLANFGRSVVRLKWLYIAILILYFGFTPGRAVFEGFAQPTHEGLTEGIYRIAVLVAILAAVHIFTAMTSRDETCRGILWLLAPLAMLGLDRSRVACRLSLTLEYVADAETLLRSAIDRRQDLGLVSVSGQVIEEVERRSRDAEPFRVTAPTERPEVHEILYPLGLALLMFVVAQLLR